MVHSSLQVVGAGTPPPQRATRPSLSPGPVNVTLFGNKVFEGVITLRVFRDHPALGWAPNPVAGVLKREGREVSETEEVQTNLRCLRPLRSW